MAKFRGSGGAVFDIAAPPEGTNRRELFDAQVASGDLAPVSEPKKPVPPKKPADPSED